MNSKKEIMDETGNGMNQEKSEKGINQRREREQTCGSNWEGNEGTYAGWNLERTGKETTNGMGRWQE